MPYDGLNDRHVNSVYGIERERRAVTAKKIYESHYGCCGGRIICLDALAMLRAYSFYSSLYVLTCPSGDFLVDFLVRTKCRCVLRGLNLSRYSTITVRYRYENLRGHPSVYFYSFRSLSLTYTSAI